MGEITYPPQSPRFTAYCKPHPSKVHNIGFFGVLLALYNGYVIIIAVVEKSARIHTDCKGKHQNAFTIQSIQFW